MLWKVWMAAKSTVGGSRSKPGLGGKDNMWVVNILMGRTRMASGMMTRMMMMMVTRMMTRVAMKMMTRMKTRMMVRMMMGDRDNIWAGEDFANMWRAEFHREIDQTVLPCGDATNKSDSKKKEILLLNFRKSHCCALGNPISGVGIGSKVEGLV